MENKLFERLSSAALSLGAFRAEVIEVSKIETDTAFREMCRANACGNYGRNWMCPPDAGEIHELMAALRTYSYALVYQTVSELEDSYDFEGMMDAGAAHNRLVQKIRDRISPAARAAITEADLILAKGQGNFETLQGCGLNVYYAFLCKCRFFADRFGVPVYTGMLVREGR